MSYENRIDKKAYEASEEPGLYFVSQCLCNPYTKEITYLVKVGRAKHMADRMSAYNTTNPMMWHIDYKYFKPSYRTTAVLSGIEQSCHRTLKMVALPNEEVRAREWFCVDEATYFDMCERGFAWFDESLTGQLLQTFAK